MRQKPRTRRLPPPHGPVYLVLLWPDPQTPDHWQGRVKVVRDGSEHALEGLEQLETLLQDLKRRLSWDQGSSLRS